MQCCDLTAAGCGDLRSTLHPDGADSLKALLAQVTALSEQVHPAALEVLVFIEVYLEGKTSSMHLFPNAKYFQCIIVFMLFVNHLGIAQPNGRVAANATLST